MNAPYSFYQGIFDGFKYRLKVLYFISEQPEKEKTFLF
tara:strand:- start:1810 stop:1923 length:114 start_codon:yes stop_codon:yes gene_type:complete